MSEALRGKVIRIHVGENHHDLGRIIYECRDAADVIYIPFPNDPSDKSAQKGRRLLAPRRVARKDIALLCDGYEVTLVDYVVPRTWNLTDDQLRDGVGLDKNRRDLPRWLEQREEWAALIAPITSSYGAYELLELGLLNSVIQDLAEKQDAESQRKIVQAMRRFLFGCGHPNALLPHWEKIGAKGTEKFCRVKTGRPSRRRAEPDAESEYVVTENDRRRLCDGWDYFKKKGVSDRCAYLRMCVKYFPGNEVEADEYERKYSIAPRSQRPTIAQFRRAAKVRGRLSASSINMGERVRRLTQRALTGNATDGVYAVGQVCLIDSTCEDQTPVSSIDLLRVLPSTYRTICMDVCTEYILGLYCGFEYPSTLTSLLAILNSASPKAEFCKMYGIDLEDGEWHSRLCKRIRADNGELKSEKGIKTLSLMEVAAEFVRSYSGDMKGPVEAVHKKIHRLVDHLAAGSTRGKKKERGETAREEEACRTFEQNMPHVIRAILRHNNEEPVPHLLTVEMRRDGVVPTRRAIYEWNIAQNYEASEPLALETLRAHCLPKLKAVLRRDGLHVFDPRDERVLIPGLVYTGKWLISSGLGEKAAKKSIRCEVQLDPQNLDFCYLYKDDELHELRRKSTDPLVSRLALCEYLDMADCDRKTVDGMQEALEASDAQAFASMDELNRSAIRAKKGAQAALPKEAGRPKKGKTKGYSKQENRDKELERAYLEGLDVKPRIPAHPVSPPLFVSLSSPPPRSAANDLMAELRSRKGSV